MKSGPGGINPEGDRVDGGGDHVRAEDTVMSVFLLTFS